ncbi:hypothetical protein [Xylella fastidiosa]|uniref:hypothetical protein n=1 Tax=Xylella fastidiosa TaxID=2371 RepID=UPI00126803D7|nr:hypothetical protein [Xylella fastidiosa]
MRRGSAIPTLRKQPGRGRPLQPALVHMRRALLHLDVGRNKMLRCAAGKCRGTVRTRAMGGAQGCSAGYSYSYSKVPLWASERKDAQRISSLSPDET